MEEIWSHPLLGQWKKILKIQELQWHEIVDNFWYKLNIDYAPREIDLDHIHMDLKNFQNRKKPYSEHSVQNIVDAVLNWNFDFRIFNPIIVWRNSKDNKLYILSGHSRYEAFKRLSTKHRDNDSVIEFTIKTWYNFDNILTMIMDDISFENAKFIALMSNALATIESDTERAEIYRSFRELNKSKKFIEEFWRKCEKNNWPRIESYSFLNPNWVIINALESFENNTDEINIIRRVAKWVWFIRMKHPELSDMHEKELFDWLIDRWWYGTRPWQINNQSKFIDVVSKHLEEIKNKWLFNSERSLNILKIQSLSNSMKEYNKLIKDLKSRKWLAISEFHSLRRTLNKKMVEDGLNENLKRFIDKIEKDISIVLDKSDQTEQLEQYIFDISWFVDEKNVKKLIKETLSYLNRIEQDYYKLRTKKEKFQKASEWEIKLDL